MNETDFQQLLNEDYPPVEVMGMQFPMGDVLRTMDYIAFRETFLDYLDSMDIEEEG